MRARQRASQTFPHTQGQPLRGEACLAETEPFPLHGPLVGTAHLIPTLPTPRAAADPSPVELLGELRLHLLRVCPVVGGPRVGALCGRARGRGWVVYGCDSPPRITGVGPQTGAREHLRLCSTLEDKGWLRRRVSSGGSPHLLTLRADEGAALHARDVRSGGSRQVAAASGERGPGMRRCCARALGGVRMCHHHLATSSGQTSAARRQGVPLDWL
jgi:hypothetical protein